MPDQEYQPGRHARLYWLRKQASEAVSEAIGMGIEDTPLGNVDFSTLQPHLLLEQRSFNLHKAAQMLLEAERLDREIQRRKR